MEFLSRIENVQITGFFRAFCSLMEVRIEEGLSRASGESVQTKQSACFKDFNSSITLCPIVELRLGETSTLKNAWLL